MNFDYEKFLKKERKKRKNLKNLYLNQKEVKRYWQDLGEHRMGEESFNQWAKKLLYDHTWQTNMEAIIEYGQIRDKEKILDVGCGWGRILVGLKKFFPHSLIWGIDIVPNFLKKAQEIIEKEIGNDKNCFLMTGDINQLKFEDDFFDKVISIRVLQYVPDPVKSLKELKRVTKNGGRVIITLPNKWNIRQIFKYHTKLYSPNEVYSWFKKNNFSEIKIGTIRFLPRFQHKISGQSKIRIIEKICAQIPLINKLGGVIIASGKK